MCARAFRVCACAGLVPLLTYKIMEEILEIFEKFGFSVALSITLLVFIYRIVNRQIKYLQDTIKELAAIIARNTEIYKLLYDYLTKN